MLSKAVTEYNRFVLSANVSYLFAHLPAAAANLV